MNNPSYYDLSLIKEFYDIMNDLSNSIIDKNILKLNKIECRTDNNQKYKVVRYDKNMLSYDLVKNYGLFRSVILNSDNKVVSFAPPKSIPCDTFIQSYPQDALYIEAQEFIEGTMINVFWDPNIGLNGAWEIATRNIVGATSSFYKSPGCKTFRAMFLDAIKSNNLDLDKLEKDKCYSFVLQHPENRIVVSFIKPQLYLVAVYQIINETNKVKVYTLEVDQFKEFFSKAINSSIMFPQIYRFNTYKELIEKYASMNTDYSILGVILYNKNTFERAKIRNPVYELVRNLRGNQPKLQYQYLCLRQQGKVKDYLKFYPENRREFSSFRDQIHLFTETLYSNYISCYIKKEKPLVEFPDQFKTHMFNIHQKYMNELREKKMHITNTIVIKYVNEMQPTLLMYCLNYHMRKRNIDYIKADTVL
jgi:hypothetical protein